MMVLSSLESLATAKFNLTEERERAQLNFADSRVSINLPSQFVLSESRALCSMINSERHQIENTVAKRTIQSIQNPGVSKSKQIKRNQIIPKVVAKNFQYDDDDEDSDSETTSTTRIHPSGAGKKTRNAAKAKIEL